MVMAMLLLVAVAISVLAGAEVVTATSSVSGHIAHLTDQGYQLSH